MIVRLRCHRTLRRWSARLRKPEAIRAPSLTVLFVDSVRALVTRVSPEPLGCRRGPLKWMVEACGLAERRLSAGDDAVLGTGQFRLRVTGTARHDTI